MKRNQFQSVTAACYLAALIVVLLSLNGWRTMAAASLYENNAVTIDPVPTPDATNFVNNNVFEIDDEFESFYQTHDTLNYTNNGYMYNGDFGFNFDDYSTATSQNLEAGTFDNENTIECLNQINVWATNIVDPGWVTVDDYIGLMQFTGDNVNLNNSTLLMESSLGSGGANPFSFDYGVGDDTNAEWNPFEDLTSTAALSSLYKTFQIPFLVNTLYLPDSTCYFHFDFLSPSNVIVRAIFVEDQNPAVSHNAYFGPGAVGSGLLTVGWSGVYTNIATGQIATNYLYLNDEPAGISSNGVNTIKVINGTPNNYTIQGSPTSLYNNPTPEGFDSVFPSINFTNNYSYLEAELQPTTMPTNYLVETNVAAVGGRIEISAAKELNLNNAVIGGENYMSLTSTNQFDGNNGAAIAAPYSDINFGVADGYTNGSLGVGNLAVSNLLESTLPIWSGTVQAWSTRWITLTTNLIGTNSVTVTNDFRVELVYDNIAPTSPSQVQNLELTGTNSVVISDNFNIFGNFFMNTRSLTLTTNGIGNGAESEFGTLNFENDSILSPSQLPYLQWLTNNGTINVGNQAMFGTAAPTFVTNKIPAVPGVAAMGALSEVHGATNVMNANKVTIGSFTYTFVKKVTNTIPNQIKIASSFGGSMSNLIKAINHSDGTGDGLYSSKTVKNTFVKADGFTNGTLLVTAITNGLIGNSIVTTTTSPNLLWSSNLLSGGANPIPVQTNIVSVSGPYQSFVNSGTLTDYGSQIYSGYFANGGIIDNNVGPFTLISSSVVLTNGELLAYFPFPPSFTNGFSGDISITASNLVVSNLVLAAGGGLTLLVTNSLNDLSVSNGNQWYLDGGSSLLGLNLPVKPTNGCLLGTTINMFTPAPNKPVKNYWSALDDGVSIAGYSNNVAIGQLVLDVTTPNSAFYFSGPPGSTNMNAIYVDRLVLEDYASYANGAGTANIPTLFFNTNLVIYYADALASSTVNGGTLEDVSDLLNHSNTNHLQWVPEYTGYFSTTNIVYPNGTTYAINMGLAQSSFDTLGNGLPAYEDPYPVFEPGEVNFTFGLTNVPPEMGVLTWDSIPSATDYVLYTTNLASQNWVVFDTITNSSQILTPSTWPLTNSLLVPLNMNTPHGYYRVRVSPSYP